MNMRDYPTIHFRSLVLYICFVECCLSFCSFFLWPLCSLFFDMRILIYTFDIFTLLLQLSFFIMYMLRLYNDVTRWSRLLIRHVFVC
jgi:hypothetical protein